MVETSKDVVDGMQDARPRVQGPPAYIDGTLPIDTKYDLPRTGKNWDEVERGYDLPNVASNTSLNPNIRKFSLCEER